MRVMLVRTYRTSGATPFKNCLNLEFLVRCRGGMGLICGECWALLDQSELDEHRKTCVGTIQGRC